MTCYILFIKRNTFDLKIQIGPFFQINWKSFVYGYSVDWVMSLMLLFVNYLHFSDFYSLLLWCWFTFLFCSLTTRTTTTGKQNLFSQKRWRGCKELSHVLRRDPRKLTLEGSADFRECSISAVAMCIVSGYPPSPVRLLKFWSRFSFSLKRNVKWKGICVC